MQHVEHVRLGGGDHHVALGDGEAGEADRARRPQHLQWRAVGRENLHAGRVRDDEVAGLVARHATRPLKAAGGHPRPADEADGAAKAPRAARVLLVERRRASAAKDGDAVLGLVEHKELIG
eukprot:6212308-Prymnesium_polylepis.1